VREYRRDASEANNDFVFTSRSAAIADSSWLPEGWDVMSYWQCSIKPSRSLLWRVMGSAWWLTI